MFNDLWMNLGSSAVLMGGFILMVKLLKPKNSGALAFCFMGGIAIWGVITFLLVVPLTLLLEP